MKSLSIISMTFVAGVAGCSLPVIGGGPSAATPALHGVAIDPAAVPPPVVQVREFWRSSVISVVAWDVDDAAFGLRASVSRTGELVGGRQFGDHRLYLTPLYARDMGGFKHASVTLGQPLLGEGTQRDSYSCFYGKECSPMVTFGVGIPDSILRANRDSLVVTFFPIVYEPWTITLRRELITAYLNKVDSVRADVRRTATM